MLKRIVLAVIVGVVVALLVGLVGVLLASINNEFCHTIGNFLKATSALWGLIAGAWYFLTGQTPNQVV